MNEQYIKFTPDGECFVEVVDGQKVEHPLRTVNFVEPLPIELTVGHMSFMNDLLEAVKELRVALPHREVPVTKSEAPGFFEETDELKGLLKAQLVKISEVSIPLVDKPERVVEAIYFTPQGRAFIRKYIDHLYAVTSET